MTSTPSGCGSPPPSRPRRPSASRPPRSPGRCRRAAMGEAAAAALVTGTILASYRFDRFKSNGDDEPPNLESLTLLGPAKVAAAAETARVVAAAQNRARDLQNTPANVATPGFLAARAEEIAADADSVAVQVLGRAELEEKGMGGLARRQPGRPRGAEADRPPLLRRRLRTDARPRRQGRHLRHRRHLAQARRRDAGDEDGHVRRRRGAGDCRRDRRAGIGGSS